ncbi:glycyl-radical enzyme activating protein [Lachnospiraceae bacterium OttesenSCG-928-D06]|nr:glycyl-radical enzyme activating protein [Lachnospiraceae bacterium OttesenSCG-928-D06]
MSDLKTALVFDIQRFSLHDGPGIRTLVFFKGCSLACTWCSNPEGISPVPEIRNNKRLCVGCGKCLQNCKAGAIRSGEEGIAINREQCKKCGGCIENCPSKALSWWGRYYTIKQLYELVKRDRPFYESSGGGVTLGGGDPLLQNEQAVALLKMCKENHINTAIETAGNYPWEYLENAAPYCDTIHLDLKGWDEEKCKKCIGSDNQRTLTNLQNLGEWIEAAEIKPALRVRIPLIPDYNFTLEEFAEMAEYLKTIKNISAIEILPFHNLGESKYTQLEKTYYFKGSQNLKEDAVAEYCNIFKQAGLPVTVTTM